MGPPPIACRREPQVTVRTKTLQCCLAPFGKGPSLHLIHRPSVAYSPPALRGRRSVLRSPKAAPRTSFSVLHRLAYAAMTRLSSRRAASGVSGVAVLGYLGWGLGGWGISASCAGRGVGG